jgi:hypothetical protein
MARREPRPDDFLRNILLSKEFLGKNPAFAATQVPDFDIENLMDELRALIEGAAQSGEGVARGISRAVGAGTRNFQSGLADIMSRIESVRSDVSSGFAEGAGTTGRMDRVTDTSPSNREIEATKERNRGKALDVINKVIEDSRQENLRAGDANVFRVIGKGPIERGKTGGPLTLEGGGTFSKTGRGFTDPAIGRILKEEQLRRSGEARKASTEAISASVKDSPPKQRAALLSLLQEMEAQPGATFSQEDLLRRLTEE